jgi:hypothetical protein
LNFRRGGPSRHTARIGFKVLRRSKLNNINWNQAAIRDLFEFSNDRDGRVVNVGPESIAPLTTVVGRKAHIGHHADVRKVPRREINRCSIAASAASSSAGGK